MTKYDFTIGDTYQRGQQERTIVKVTDTMIHYQNKTDKKLGMMHTCCKHEFANWALKAAKKGENGEFVVPPDRLTVAQLEENQIEVANELATNLVAFIFKANVDTLKAKEGTND